MPFPFSASFWALSLGQDVMASCGAVCRCWITRSAKYHSPAAFWIYPVSSVVSIRSCTVLAALFLLREYCYLNLDCLTKEQRVVSSSLRPPNPKPDIYLLQPRFPLLWGCLFSFLLLWERTHKHQGELHDPVEGGGAGPGVFLLLMPLSIRGNCFNDLVSLWITRCPFPFGPACSQCCWPWSRDRL